MVCRKQLPIHPAANIPRMMSESEYAELRESIRKIGLLNPIWIWTDSDGKTWIIDGRNRYRACLELGIEPAFIEWDGQGSLVEFIFSQNIRRDLNASQRASMARKFLAMMKEEAEQVKRQNLRIGRDSPEREKVPNGERSRDRVAAIAKVSGRYIERADAVLSRALPEVSAAVDAGTLTISGAERIANLPPLDQRAICRKLTSGTAKTVRQATEQLYGVKADAGEDENPDPRVQCPCCFGKGKVRRSKCREYRRVWKREHAASR